MDRLTKQLLPLAFGLLLISSAARAQSAPASSTDTARTTTTASGAAAPAPAAAPETPEVLECHTLTGRVADAFDYPLTGATVMLRSADKAFSVDAFSTNAEGRYLITSKKPIPRNTVLMVSAAGYTSIEQPLADCKPLDVSLELLPGTRIKANGRIKKTATAGKIK